MAPWGEVFVLDSVRLRVLVVAPDGTSAGEIPLPAATFEDLAVAGRDALLLLDRTVGRALLVVDLWGRPRAEVPLVGRGIPHPGQVTAILPRSDGVWLEVRHRYSVRVLDAALRPCSRRIRRGRPGTDGLSLHAALTDDGGVRLWRTDGVDRAVRSEALMRDRLPAYRIVWLDQSPGGDILVAMHGARFEPTQPGRVAAEHTVFAWLDAALRERARFSSPYTLGPRYQRGEVRLDPNGGVWQMAVTDGGALLLRFDRDGRAP